MYKMAFSVIFNLYKYVFLDLEGAKGKILLIGWVTKYQTNDEIQNSKPM